MTTTTEALRARLLAHAEIHEADLAHDEEQRQWAADLREAAAALSAIDAAPSTTGESPKHLYADLCPDERQPDARDPECPACRLMDAAPSVEPVAPDWLLRSKVADLLHLLEFSAISTATGSDDVQARRAMADLKRILHATPQAQPAAPACSGAPGECHWNGACMYGCGATPQAQPAAPNAMPVAWFCQWFDAEGAPEWDQYHDSTDPMPAADEWEDRPPDRVTPLYATPQAQPAAVPLPARLVLFTLRDLKAERKRLDGFLSLGNEVGRAAEYDEWIAALEAYAAAHGIGAAAQGGEHA